MPEAFEDRSPYGYYDGNSPSFKNEQRQLDTTVQMNEHSMNNMPSFNSQSSREQYLNIQAAGVKYAKSQQARQLGQVPIQVQPQGQGQISVNSSASTSSQPYFRSGQQQNQQQRQNQHQHQNGSIQGQPHNFYMEQRQQSRSPSAQPQRFFGSQNNRQPQQIFVVQQQGQQNQNAQRKIYVGVEQQLHQHSLSNQQSVFGGQQNRNSSTATNTFQGGQQTQQVNSQNFYRAIQQQQGNNLRHSNTASSRNIHNREKLIASNEIINRNVVQHVQGPGTSNARSNHVEVIYTNAPSGPPFATGLNSHHPTHHVRNGNNASTPTYRVVHNNPPTQTPSASEPRISYVIRHQYPDGTVTTTTAPVEAVPTFATRGQASVETPATHQTVTKSPSKVVYIKQNAQEVPQYQGETIYMTQEETLELRNSEQSTPQKSTLLNARREGDHSLLSALIEGDMWGRSKSQDKKRRAYFEEEKLLEYELDLWQEKPSPNTKLALRSWMLASNYFCDKSEPCNDSIRTINEYASKL